VIALIAAVWGRGEQVGYVNKHYTRSTLFLADGGPQAAFDFTRDLRDKRIAFAGSGLLVFGQYGFYGIDLSNYVQYIGRCEQFIEKINKGNYDYVITSEFTRDSSSAPYRYPIKSWVENDPAATLVIAEPDITPQATFVYSIDGKLDPGACRKLDREALESASPFEGFG
jgi:hypothetical protein